MTCLSSKICFFGWMPVTCLPEFPLNGTSVYAFNVYFKMYIDVHSTIVVTQYCDFPKIQCTHLWWYFKRFLMVTPNWNVLNVLVKIITIKEFIVPSKKRFKKEITLSMRKVNLQEVPNQTYNQTQYYGQFIPSCPDPIITNNGQQIIPNSPSNSSSNEDNSDQDEKSLIEHSTKLCNVRGERCL